MEELLEIKKMLASLKEQVEKQNLKIKELEEKVNKNSNSIDREKKALFYMDDDKYPYSHYNDLL